MRINRWLIVLASVAGLMLAPVPAAACGCTPIVDRPMLTPLAEVQEQLGWADQVFLGRVTHRAIESITLTVEAYWKGTGAATQTLRGGSVLSDGTEFISDCDFGFASDVRYVVFAHRTSLGLVVSSCSMTRQFEHAGELIELLDRATPRQIVKLGASIDRRPPNLQMQPTRRVTPGGARLVRRRQADSSK